MKKNRNSKATLPGRRSDLAIMGKLIVLVKPLSGIMLTGIVLGVLGFLCAIFLTVLSGYGVLKGIFELFGKESLESLSLSGNAFCSLEIGWPTLFRLLLLFAIARGILHYGEQYCNHYIAFRILAMIRHRVFAALRKLCPAKLEGKEKGNLISVITGDIELLEVFFAHTVSPVAIAFLTSLIMLFFIGKQHPLAALLAFFAYFTVAFLLPIWNGRRSASAGMALRSEMGDLNNFVLD
ncbi:ABC transporter transmembrane domain-containing protein, partial [Oribacterium sinus]